MLLLLLQVCSPLQQVMKTHLSVVVISSESSLT